MTTTTTTPTTQTTTDHATARRVLPWTAGITTAVAVTLSITRSHSMPEWIVEVLVELVAAALLFGLVVPRGLRRASAGGRGIAMGVVAVLLVVPAFWAGLPLLLGAAAALLGSAGRRADRGAGSAVAALVLGLLGVAAYVAIYLTDFILNP